MTKVYIHDYTRTPMGKSKRGVFRNTGPLKLSTAVVDDLVVDREVDEIVWGTVQQYGEQGYNIARQISLLSGLDVPAITLNRLCGSSMSAVHYAYANIKAELGHEYLVGGVEHMGKYPMTEHYYDSPDMPLVMAKGSMSMGLTAEMVAKIHNISREEQDEFAISSHKKAFYLMKAYDSFTHVEGHSKNGVPIIVKEDEPIRGDTNSDNMAKLKPVFDPRNGTITAGNSSAISDGASAMIISSSETNAIARIVSTSVVSLPPAVMGYGPVPAVTKALQDAKLTKDDIETWEINEAFAAQSLACIKDLGIDNKKVNHFGGAIAIGHPLGCSGSRIIGTLISSMRYQGTTLGCATMCIGAGQGVATIIEMV